VIALSDRQLAIVMEAAKPLPPEKRSIYLERVDAMLRLRRRGKHFDDGDVIDVAAIARVGLFLSLTSQSSA
jgi:hypothetical protein